MELTHLATLYHDDVMDEADLRRGAQSANARWDNSIAILTGDFLFARASDIVADLGPDAVRIQAQSLLATGPGSNPGDDRAARWRGSAGALPVGRRRQDRLLDCDVGAIRRKAHQHLQQVEATLTEFGEQIGTAFQLSDDIIDVASETSDSARPLGRTCARACRPYPTLIAQATGDAEDVRLLELLSGPIDDDRDHEEALGLLRSHRAMDEARAEVAGVPTARGPCSPTCRTFQRETHWRRFATYSRPRTA